MGKRGWVIAVVLLGAAVGHLWWQNGRLRRGRNRAVAALEDRDARGARGTFEREAPAAPARPDEVKAALAQALPATGEPGEGEDAEPPPAQRHWAVEFFTPHPGENLGAYRDRVLPVVQAVAEPQRKRVRRWRDDFVKEAQLSESQQRELDAAVGDAGEQIKDRLFEGLLSGELGPRTKASAGVAFARDVLDIADGANQRFRNGLSAAQRSALDGGRFDVIDYLFFATRWEDMLGVEE